jgi:hypothetical protein
MNHETQNRHLHSPPRRFKLPSLHANGELISASEQSNAQSQESKKALRKARNLTLEEDGVVDPDLVGGLPGSGNEEDKLRTCMTLLLGLLERNNSVVDGILPRIK